MVETRTFWQQPYAGLGIHLYTSRLLQNVRNSCDGWSADTGHQYPSWTTGLCSWETWASLYGRHATIHAPNGTCNTNSATPTATLLGEHKTDYADSGNHYLDDVAYWAHTNDLRPCNGTADGLIPVLNVTGHCLQGLQNVTVYTFFAFGNIAGREILMHAAQLGDLRTPIAIIFRISSQNGTKSSMQQARRELMASPTIISNPPTLTICKIVSWPPLQPS